MDVLGSFCLYNLRYHVRQQADFELDVHTGAPFPNGCPSTTCLPTPTDLSKRRFSPYHYTDYNGTYLPPPVWGGARISVGPLELAWR